MDQRYGQRSHVIITVSGPMLRQRFHPCTVAFIASTCHGRCCESSKGVQVVIHPSERERIEQLGASIVNGYIKPDHRGLCPFKTEGGLCAIHGPEKPFGCKTSPFTLNRNDLLVVRNRYRSLVCYRADGALPAYEAHQWSLAQILGGDEARRVSEFARAGHNQIAAIIGLQEYTMLKDNDDVRHQRRTPRQLAWKNQPIAAHPGQGI